MVFCYILLYQQCESLMIESRITLSHSIMPKIQKSAKCVQALWYGVLATFVIVQIVLMGLSLFSLVDLNVFFWEITGFIGCLILGVNFYLIFTYLKMTGVPYKNHKSYQSVKWIGMVGGYWSLAFTIKFVTVLLGHSLYQVESNENNKLVF